MTARGLFFSFLIVLNYSLTSFAASYSFPRIQKSLGQTFHKMGPNCFAAALFGAGLHSSLRGVSHKEFSQVIETHCKEVKVPQPGDIGYYYIEGFAPTHAFTYISQTQAFEKPGVDYVGKTPLRINSLTNIDYVHRADPYCRRSGSKDCYSQFKIIRCKKLPKTSALFSLQLERLEKMISTKLDGSDDHKTETLGHYWRVLKEVAQSDYEKSVLHSLDLQIKFFEH